MVAHDDVARGRIRRFRQHRARARRSSRGAGRSIASIGGDVRATFYAVSIRARAARAVSSRREIRRARAVPSRRGLTTTRSMMRVCATVGGCARVDPAGPVVRGGEDCGLEDVGGRGWCFACCWYVGPDEWIVFCSERCVSIYYFVYFVRSCACVVVDRRIDERKSE